MAGLSINKLFESQTLSNLNDDIQHQHKPRNGED